MRNTIVIMCALAIVAWAVQANGASREFYWNGSVDAEYETAGNWDVPTGATYIGPPLPDDPVWIPEDPGPPVVPAHWAYQPVKVWLNSGDTVVNVNGDNWGGVGWKRYLTVGSSYDANGAGAGDGHLHIKSGGKMRGALLLGNNGYDGTVIQDGDWYCTGGADCCSTYCITLGESTGSTGTFELRSGYLGQDGTEDPNERGTGYFQVGAAGTGVLIQSAGTRIQTRSSYPFEISESTAGDGTYTMNGGTLRTHYMFMGRWGTGGSATWNINSTDVDIVIGENYNTTNPDKGAIRFNLGYGTKEMYLSAAEGSAGETVQIKIIGGQFRNDMDGSGGKDANVAGLNNITMAFEKPNWIATGGVDDKNTFEVAGKDLGDDYHGLCNNFALEGLIIGGTAGGGDALYMLLRDNVDNMADGDNNEVLYVENLTVNVDSWLLLDGRTIYYYKADIDDMSKILLSGGSLVQLTPISGDANMDVVVDDSDLSLLLSNFGDPGAWGEGDFNDDGNVDDSDLSLLLSNFGEDACTLASTVPEPATLTLLGLGALALIRRRRQ